MNTIESLIEHFGGLNKVKDIIHSHARDDVYCPGNKKWFTAAFWDLHMKGCTGIPMDQLSGAFMLADKIICLGGTHNGNLYSYKDNGQREVRLHHPLLEESPIYDYSKFAEYASDIAVPKEIKFDVYRVEVFVLDRKRRLFLVFPELFKDKDKLLGLVKQNWEYGYYVGSR